MALNSAQRKILTRWVLAFLGLTAACFMAAYAGPARYLNAWMYFTGSFSLLAVLFMYQVTRAVQLDAVRSGSGVLGAIAVKQLGSMVLIIVYLFRYYEKDRMEIYICLLTFLLYAVLAWFFAYRLNRKDL